MTAQMRIVDALRISEYHIGLIQETSILMLDAADYIEKIEAERDTLRTELAQRQETETTLRLALSERQHTNDELRTRLAEVEKDAANLHEALTICVCAMQDYQAGIGITEMFDKGERIGREALARSIERHVRGNDATS